MLSDLVRLIEKSLLAYLCTKEKKALVGKYDMGIGRLVKQCPSLSQQREKDIMHILSFCQQAQDACDCQQMDNGTQNVLPFVHRLTDYLNLMPTGFIFNTGQSALKEQVINAIMLYDPRLLMPRKPSEAIIVNEFTYQQPLAMHLKPAKTQAVPDVSLAERLELLSINSQKQFEMMLKQQQSIERAQADIAKLSGMVEQKDITIATLEAEILALKGDLWHAQQAAGGKPVAKNGQSGPQFAFA